MSPSITTESSSLWTGRWGRPRRTARARDRGQHTALVHERQRRPVGIGGLRGSKGGLFEGGNRVPTLPFRACRNGCNGPTKPQLGSGDPGVSRSGPLHSGGHGPAHRRNALPRGKGKIKAEGAADARSSVRLLRRFEDRVPRAKKGLERVARQGHDRQGLSGRRDDFGLESSQHRWWMA